MAPQGTIPMPGIPICASLNWQQGDRRSASPPRLMDQEPAMRTNVALRLYSAGSADDRAVMATPLAKASSRKRQANRDADGRAPGGSGAAGRPSEADRIC